VLAGQNTGLTENSLPGGHREKKKDAIRGDEVQKHFGNYFSKESPKGAGPWEREGRTEGLHEGNILLTPCSS